jgi:hypothetical protein
MCGYSDCCWKPRGGAEGGGPSLSSGVCSPCPMFTASCVADARVTKRCCTRHLAQLRRKNCRGFR